jgi:hypothetical protein
VTVWNRCIREKLAFPYGHATDTLPEYLNWRTVSDHYLEIDGDCSRFIGMFDVLEARYGLPIASDNPGNCAGLIPQVQICPAMSDGLGFQHVSPCKEVAAAPFCWKKTYLAKDRATPITFELRTYRLRAVYEKQDYDFTKYREFYVGVLQVSSSGDQPPVPSVDRGFTIFRYLQ